MSVDQRRHNADGKFLEAGHPIAEAVLTRRVEDRADLDGLNQAAAVERVVEDDQHKRDCELDDRRGQNESSQRE